MTLSEQALPHLQALITDSEPLYAIIDAAQDKKVIDLLLKYDEQTPLQSLFEGQPARDLAPVAPYLAQFKTADDPLLKELVHQGWGNNWSVYFNYASDFVSARQHLRQFIRVKTSEGEYRLFRFYDPRVFRKLIPTLDMSQLISFYSAIGNYWLEDVDPHKLRRYYIRDLQLATDLIDTQKSHKTVAETTNTQTN